MTQERKSIHPDTRLGAVALVTPDLARAVLFYHDLLGLEIRRREARAAHLRAGENEVLSLQEVPQAALPGRMGLRTTGLYHLAIRVPSRLELARVLQRLVEAGWPLQGFADHGVSEAVYLADADGNGVEIYRDRPRSQWPHRDGKLAMVSDPLDLEGVMAELNHSKAARGESASSAGKNEGDAGNGQKVGNPGRIAVLPGRAMVDAHTIMGHVHLRVADIPDTEAFYCGILGFDLVQRYGSRAGFISAGGYHHHIGFNTWESYNAPPPPAGSAGLQYFTVRLPDARELERVQTRLEGASWPVEAFNGGVLVRDPSHNGVLLTAVI
jgi:catechol 2,3-dioxygenase